MSRAILRQSDRLVASSVLVSILLVWSALVGFDAITALIEDLQLVGNGQFTVWTALQKTGFTIPRRLYELFPNSAMIGCVLGLGGLAATSELTALRAAGLSKARICLGAAITVAALTFGLMLVGETLGPWGELRSQTISAKARSKDVAMASWSGLWAREGDTFLNARYGRTEGEAAHTRVVLEGVVLYEFDPDGRLLSIAQAEQAIHADARWTLHKVHRAFFEKREVRNTSADSEAWPSKLKPELLSLSLQRPRYLSTATLRESLDYMERNGLDPGPFAIAYWARWFYPVNVLALCLAVMPFAFGALRSGGFGKRLFFGLVFGLGYFIVQRLAVDIAQVYRVDLRVANLMPPLLLGLGTALYFRRTA